MLGVDHRYHKLSTEKEKKRLVRLQKKEIKQNKNLLWAQMTIHVIWAMLHQEGHFWAFLVLKAHVGVGVGVGVGMGMGMVVGRVMVEMGGSCHRIRQ